MNITWPYSKDAHGRVRLTGYEPEDQSGAGDALTTEWTDPEDMLNMAVADDLTGPVAGTLLDRILVGIVAAPTGDRLRFSLPAAD